MSDFNVETATLQEICDYSVKKIVEQGIQCMLGNDCAYGDGKGNHCAIGWLLDHDNKDLMRYCGPVDELAYNKELREYVPNVIKKSLSPLGKLQAFHDSDTKSSRQHARELLTTSFGIRTDGEHWQQWVDLGSDEQADY